MVWCEVADMMQAICKLTPTVIIATLFMVHEQSSCTHTSFAHAVARFQLALASEGILKLQVANHLIYGHNGG